jgi:hypothetical protein
MLNLKHVDGLHYGRLRETIPEIVCFAWETEINFSQECWPVDWILDLETPKSGAKVFVAYITVTSVLSLETETKYKMSHNTMEYIL